MKIFRFGLYRFDAESGELSRDGQPIRLQPQPGLVLATLLTRAGQLVTRDELRAAVWPDDTFVDFDRGLNFCIAQVRAALNDEAAAPRYIRTVPKRGYEFICPVEAVGSPAVVQAAGPRDAARGRLPLRAAAAVAAVALAAAAAYLFLASRAAVPVVAVARIDNETGDPSLTRFGDVLTDTIVEQLTRQSAGRYAVVGNAAVLRRARDQRDLGEIGASLHAGYVVLTELQRDDERLRVLAHLIRLPEQTHVTVSRIDGIASVTLTESDAIAARIAGAFAARLRGADGGSSRVAANR